MHQCRRLAIASALILLLHVITSPAAIAHELSTSDAPVPISFPRDDGPHDAGIEWWYYTGHLFTSDGNRYGFEFVVFKGKQAPVTAYASHFAITDNEKGTFQYDQRLALAPVDASFERQTGFDLSVVDWHMSGVDGNDRLVAEMPSHRIELKLSSSKPPVLHDGDGYIDYGENEGSYYYSRTRMDASGVLTIAGVSEAVTGEAWFDHQWGDFTTYSSGGWDWYAIMLDDQTELMLYVTRDENGETSITDGSFVDQNGALTVLEAEDFSAGSTSTWTSASTGVTYPSGWIVSVPSLELELTLAPSLASQELDTTASTGVTYWEGEIVIEGTKGGDPVNGLGYVELTGYAPAVPIGATPIAG